MNYTNREVVKRLKQYDMFLSSLNLTTDSLQKERICDQLDKIEKQILLDTNTEYEEEQLIGNVAKYWISLFDIRVNEFKDILFSVKSAVDNLID